MTFRLWVFIWCVLIVTVSLGGLLAGAQLSWIFPMLIATVGAQYTGGLIWSDRYSTT